MMFGLILAAASTFCNPMSIPEMPVGIECWKFNDGDIIRKAFEIRKPAKLSQPALEVLTIIAYYQPTTRAYVDQIRGVEVNKALDILHFSKREASIRLEKLLRSAIANWEAKNQDNVKALDNGEVIVKTIMVDEGATLKRIRPCPQGRAGRIRKRSNHVTIILDTKKPVEE